MAKYAEKMFWDDYIKSDRFLETVEYYIRLIEVVEHQAKFWVVRSKCSRSLKEGHLRLMESLHREAVDFNFPFTSLVEAAYKIVKDYLNLNYPDVMSFYIQPDYVTDEKLD